MNGEPGGPAVPHLGAAAIPELVRAAGEHYGGAEAVADGDVRLSFAELAERVQHACGAFTEAGLVAGDRVAMWAPNGASWIVAALGAVTAGGVLVPMTTRFKADEAAWIVNRAGARFACAAGDFAGTRHADILTAADCPALDTVIPLDPPGTLTPLSVPGSVSRQTTDSGLCRDTEREGEVTVGAASISDIIFTSGTTGRPKGVMVTHDQSLRVFMEWSRIVGLEQGDRYLVVNPFSHTFGYKAGILACLMRGACIVPQAMFDVDATLALVERERITVLPGAPTIYLSILDHPDRDRHDLSSLRLAVTGAAAVPVEMIRRMRSELTFTTILTAYGLTEATGTVTMCRRGDHAETIATTSGRAISDVEVRVVDDTGADVPPGSPGEIVCRGYNVMVGYYDDTEATAAAIDVDGWLHTGDIGVIDELGNVDITDRKKDMYVCGGFNAYPAEIENTVLEHLAVAHVAVIGMPDERLGEVGWAFVIPRHGTALDPDELVTWCRERMANYKVPRRVVITDAFPTNAVGKTLKFELRQRAANC